jgi:hypothetical protein
MGIHRYGMDMNGDSYIGGGIAMIALVSLIMAICRCSENPDLFITFTCNVNWPEIHREIKKTRNYQPEDEPNIIVRVFHSKLIDMMSFIKSGKHFGRTIAGISILFLKFQVFFFSFASNLFYFFACIFSF